MVSANTKTKNRMYQRTEMAILEALMSSKELPTVSTLVRRAKISRSTLYRHHKTVPGIIPDYEGEILAKYANMLRGLVRRKHVQVRTIYFRILIFMIINRRIFEILMKYDGSMVIEKMVMKLSNKLRKACRLPKNPDKMLHVYAKEIAGVVEEWEKLGFDENEVEMTLSKILYLTETMRQRLGPLNR